MQRPAGAGRHHVDREVRAARRDAAPEGLGAARLLRPERVRGALYRRRRRQARPRCSRCSTRATTSRKPTSSRRPACPARSPSPPTWRAAAPTSSSAAMPTCASARSSPTSRTTRRAMRDPRADEIRAQVARLKEKALAAGGLFVLGTERHESRRIDNQLRGRSGRQGDPGPLEVLPLARRRPDAHLRVRQARRHADRSSA